MCFLKKRKDFTPLRKSEMKKRLKILCFSAKTDKKRYFSAGKRWYCLLEDRSSYIIFFPESAGDFIELAQPVIDP